MKSESEIQEEIRLESPNQGIRLFRNNVGACMDQTGRLIRYGLGNDSKRISSVLKSSDLIGLTQYTITPEDVGKTVAVFTSIEVKKEGWRYKGTPREKAQKNWIDLIVQLGGIAFFATSAKDIIRAFTR